MSKILANLKIVVLAVIFAAGVSYISAWTGPGSGVTPPNNNVSAPLNVGSSTQAKAGALVLNSGWTDSLGNAVQAATGLEVFGTSSFQGSVQINSGSPQPGYVLTAQDTNGTAEWVAGGGAAASSHHTIVFDYSQITDNGTVVTAFPYTSSAGTIAKTGSGTYAWTAPVGVSSATVDAWGGGGGAYVTSGSPINGSVAHTTEAGGACGYAESFLEITPGNSYVITVANGGMNGTTQTFGTNTVSPTSGGTSSFGSSVVAYGGGSATSGSVSGSAVGYFVKKGDYGFTDGNNNIICSGGYYVSSQLGNFETQASGQGGYGLLIVKI
jgi:hypothetical protein